MLGETKLASYEEMVNGNFSQKVATARSVIESAELTGARYRVVAYYGTQPVRGTNYLFIAEQTLTTAKIERHLVKLAVNEFQGEFTLVGKSIERID